MGLESLSPNRRTQYEALLPELERSVRSAQNGRGMFYSGEAVDAEAKARAELLAKLAGQDASEQAQASESARDRELTEKIKREEIKAGKRNALLNIVGTGAGAATTLAGLKYLNPGGGSNVVAMNGRLFEKSPKGSWVDVTPTTGAGGQAPIEMTPTTPGGNIFEAGAYGPEAAAVPAAATTVAAQPSMWKSAIAPANLAAGAAGGLGGYSLSRLVNGRGSTAADIGAGVGGAGGALGGLALASKFGYSNPWAMGLGALAGSFGGGLLGNLFR